MQNFWVGHGDDAVLVTLPAADQDVLPGVVWGCASRPFSPAYWAIRCRWPQEDLPTFFSRDRSLIEEVAFCLLGGFGIRYEVNRSAFDHLKRQGVFDLSRKWSPDQIIQLLAEPLDVGGKRIRYRFPNQRARRLALMLDQLAVEDLSDLPASELRSSLQRLEGVGPKTASWIVRNFTDSDEVAILDVHVIRACRWMALFPESIELPRDYQELEEIFLEFSSCIGVRPSVLDAVMWSEVRDFTHH
jgi:N-glycosylase/DNA lyase